MISKHRTWNNGLGHTTLLDCVYSIIFDIGEDNGRMAETLLPEYLNSLNHSSLPTHGLRLRKNCIVMFIRNVSIDEGLCNGTRLQVLDFSNHLLKCKILTGDKVGETVFFVSPYARKMNTHLNLKDDNFRSN